MKDVSKSSKLFVCVCVCVLCVLCVRVCVCVCDVCVLVWCYMEHSSSLQFAFLIMSEIEDTLDRIKSHKVVPLG